MAKYCGTMLNVIIPHSEINGPGVWEEVANIAACCLMELETHTDKSAWFVGGETRAFAMQNELRKIGVRSEWQNAQQ